MENKPSDKRSNMPLDKVLYQVAKIEHDSGEPDKIWKITDIDDLIASTDADSTALDYDDDDELLMSIAYYKTDTLTMTYRRSMRLYIQTRKSRNPSPTKSPSRKKLNPKFRRTNRRLRQKQKPKSLPSPQNQTRRSRPSKTKNL